MTTLKTTVPKPLPTAKISAAIKTALPKRQGFKLHIAETGMGRLKIVRVVTPAWKRLWPGDRIRKVLAALEGVLSPDERKDIFRFSVLTPEEYRDVVLHSPATRTRKVVRNGGAKQLAARRKAARKPKRALAK